jgi:hypothetical protein
VVLGSGAVAIRDLLHGHGFICPGSHWKPTSSFERQMLETPSVEPATSVQDIMLAAAGKRARVGEADEPSAAGYGHTGLLRALTVFKENKQGCLHRMTTSSANLAAK